MPTHGSLTKAGKVRSQTPKIDGKTRISAMPRYRVRRNYVKRVTLSREIGQNPLKPNFRRRRRRR